MNKLVAFLFLLIVANTLQAQSFLAQDCINATTICNSTLSVSQAYSGNGTIDEINANISCLGAGELNSAWYKIFVPQNGLLGFNLIPNSTNSDYDWAVYNLTNAACSQIFYDTTLQVACNFSGSVTNSGITGPNGGTNLQDEELIPVQAGEVYAIVISNFGGSSGYMLDFSLSTIATGGQPAAIKDIVPANCTKHDFTLILNQPVKCDNIQPANFGVVNANTNFSFTVTGAQGLGCDTAGYTAAVKITTAEAMVNGHSYIAKLNGYFETLCGAGSNIVSQKDFIASSLKIEDIVVNQRNCWSSAELVPLFNAGPYAYNYVWTVPNGTSFSQYTAPFTLNQQVEGTYTLVVSYNGCVDTLTKQIDLINADNFTLVVSGDTIFCMPPNFVEYQWAITEFATNITQRDTTYQPQNYIVLSDYFSNTTDEFGIGARAFNSYGCYTNQYLSIPLGTIEKQANPFKVNTLVTDNLNIQFTQALSGNLYLTNLIGQTVAFKAIDNVANAVFDMQQLPNGVYILSCTTNKHTYSTKIVKAGY